eukprot:scaffold24404_cov103-Cylindrotheca_fusiformis.AAC.2
MSLEQEDNEVAYNLIGTPITIQGVGGYLRLSEDKNSIVTEYAQSRSPPARFVMERVKEEQRCSGGHPQLVAFRLEGTDKYLTQNPYGNEAQATALESISMLPMLPEIQQEVVDFAVPPDTDSAEGEGFDYQSMRLETGPPNYLQLFSLTGRGLVRVGIRSTYGKFWRAPGWSDHVLQSPHQLGDETFRFYRAN